MAKKRAGIEFDLVVWLHTAGSRALKISMRRVLRNNLIANSKNMCAAGTKVGEDRWAQKEA